MKDGYGTDVDFAPLDPLLGSGKWLSPSVSPLLGLLLCNVRPPLSLSPSGIIVGGFSEKSWTLNGDSTQSTEPWQGFERQNTTLFHPLRTVIAIV